MIEEIDGRDNLYILGGLRIQVAQLKYGFTAGFWGITDILSVIIHSYTVTIQCY